MLFVQFIFAVLFAHFTSADEISIYNYCGQDLYTWETGSAAPRGPLVLAAGSNVQYYAEQDAVPGVGTVIAISKDPNGINNGAGQLNFQYTLNDDGSLWYEMSTNNGEPFKGKRIDATFAPASPPINWPEGVKPVGDGTRYNKKFEFATIKLCVGSKQKKRFEA
ncbi:hypothetical protein BDV95DRAFT_503845 [Massariosphaeria phaeospora]|uniref:BYS1 domain protein n=1 Tax=Massariosphaeria phaeospora TaxID=100035 RepID=A0A7C8I051_9PLEO|nr:hypothetical protein BDV95DRAFT_503845 [Massariosphaeria phaeospora]